MAAPVYTYLIADLRTNVVLEEVRLHAVSFNKPLNASGRFDASWKLSPATDRLDPYRLTTPCKRAVYAIRDDRPMWGGIIWTRDYDSATETVRISAGEFWSYFDHRWVLPVLPADPDLFAVAGLPPTGFDNVDQNAIARGLLALAQSHTGGDIGIEIATDTSLSDVLRDRNYPPWKLSSVGDMLRNLTNVIGGQDLVFDVAPGTGAAPRRVLRQGTPWLGQQGSAHRWEIGGNVTRYGWPSDGTRMLTRAAAVGEGIDEGTPIAIDEDPGRYAQGWPLLEGDIGYDGDSADVLFGHAQADREVSRMPVVLPTLITRGDSSPTAAEVDRGDDGVLVVPRGGDRFHTRGLEAPVRVVDMKFTPGAQAERVELTLAPLLDGVA
ncbi:hypothetical protein [Umezawaea beigongshangensis]|uniref:hypothetical protein n=1 Tax=Umezawaea beigongshangensis TaxID=2780383 RepID=UPI0018F1F088|nr:hypothetical protein [Umezawaea beigongshangensis]